MAPRFLLPHEAMTQQAVSAVNISKNEKVGIAHATYVSQKSCPTTCPLLNAGCYAEHGNIAFHLRRMNKAAEALGALELARLEADAIEAKLSGSLDLRIHVVGDCTTNEAASIVSQAALSKLRSSKKPWSYSHAWRSVDRSAWGDVSVLASCETPAQVVEAQDRGWATAMIVDKFQGDKLYTDGQLKVLPCPNQTREVKCVDCRLCLGDTRLRDKGITIGFAAHGSRFKKVQALVQLARSAA